LSKQVAVSFEDNLVKVVYASSDKGRTVVQKTTIFKDEEFDSFLKTTRLPDLTVVCHFKRFYSDIMIAPPAKPAYLKKIVEAEIRKRFPELRDFSYFYSVPAGTTAGEKGLREVFFFAVDNNELNEIVERFNKYGKSAKYIYPNVLTLSHLIRSSDDWKNKTVLSLLISEKDRTLFLAKNGKVCFVRVTPSLGREITDVDIDNINMTVSYCRQNLRLYPELIILMNTVKKESGFNTIIPTTNIIYPMSVIASEETLRNFAAPVSAIIFGKQLRNDNLLPRKYGVLYTQKRIASYAVVFFLLFSLIALGHILINLSEIFLINKKINLLRKDLAGIDAVTSVYEKDMERMQQFLPLINFVNESHSSPDILQALVSLKFLPMENVQIKTIQLNNKKDSSLIQVSGIIKAKNYGDMHRIFIKLLTHFSNVPGMKVISKNIELRDGHFQIDVENKI
jgi:hypothetical protein